MLSEANLVIHEANCPRDSTYSDLITSRATQVRSCLYCKHVILLRMTESKSQKDNSLTHSLNEPTLNNPVCVFFISILQSLKNLPGIGGIMLWDVSWDQNNVISGQRYSGYAFRELGNIIVPSTQSTPLPLTSQFPTPSTTVSSPSPVITQTPPPPTSKSLSRPNLGYLGYLGPNNMLRMLQQTHSQVTVS